MRAARWGLILTTLFLSGCPGEVPTAPKKRSSETPESGRATDKLKQSADDRPSVEKQTSEKTAPQDHAIETNTNQISAQIKSWAETQKLIKAQQGKIVVLDIWSTACAPCIREFPGLVALHNKHREKIVCISLNTDFYGETDAPSQELQARVLEFLTQQRATCTNLISSDTDEDVFDQAKAASIPIVLVYDKKGALAEKFVENPEKYGKEGFSYEKQINPLVEKLLAGE